MTPLHLAATFDTIEPSGVDRIPNDVLLVV